MGSFWKLLGGTIFRRHFSRSTKTGILVLESSKCGVYTDSFFIWTNFENLLEKKQFEKYLIYEKSRFFIEKSYRKGIDKFSDMQIYFLK